MSVVSTLQQLGGCQGGIAVYSAAQTLCVSRNTTNPARTLRPETVATLQCILPQLDFTKIRYKTQCSLPANWYPGGHTAAMTFGNTIYIKGGFNRTDPDDFLLMLHECVHVAQYQRWGESSHVFACNYGQGYLAGGGQLPPYIANPTQYHLNPLEAEAYSLEAQFRDSSGNANTALIPWLPQRTQTVDAMVTFANGVITSFANSAIYVSPNGTHLGGGGSTVYGYNGQANLNGIIPFKNGAITAFFNVNTGRSWGIYRSPDGMNLGGGGNSSRIYSGQAIVSAMIPFQQGVIAAFFHPRSLKGWGAYYSKDGHSITGQNNVTVYAGEAVIDKMIPFKGGVIASFYNARTNRPWGVYYSKDGLNLAGGNNGVLVYSGSARVESLLAFSGGVLTAFYDPARNAPWGIYLSPDGLNLGGGGNTSLVYNGAARVDAMIPFKNGVITSFVDPATKKAMGIYGSPDGANPGGGTGSWRLYAGTNRARRMAPYGNNILVALDGCGIYLSDGTQVGSLAQRVYP
jgi:hypothetical protein